MWQALSCRATVLSHQSRVTLPREVAGLGIGGHLRPCRIAVQQAKPIQHRHVKLLLYMGQPQML